MVEEQPEQVDESAPRKAQDKPTDGQSPRPPTQRESEAIKRAVAYCRGRTEPLAFKIKGVEGEVVTLDFLHDDTGGFIAQWCATFGTPSQAFASRAAADISDITRSRGHAQPLEDQLNAAFAAVAGIEPENEQEGMLAVQMVGVHSVAMDMLSRAKQAGSPEQVERFGTLATKMLRTYTAQMEALAKIRRGGEQKVKVEHVHVYEGGQAIVGHVEHRSGGGGARLETGRQAHALTGSAALALQDGGSMRRADQGGHSMPVTGREGEGPVPNARRRKGQRRAQG